MIYDIVGLCLYNATLHMFISSLIFFKYVRFDVTFSSIGNVSDVKEDNIQLNETKCTSLNLASDAHLLLLPNEKYTLLLYGI